MAKKSFKDNPAMAFISQEEQQEPVKEVRMEEIPAPGNSGTEPPKGYKLNPMYIETKSRRMQLLVQPSTADGMKELAKKRGESVNELANQALKEFLERSRD